MVVSLFTKGKCFFIVANEELNELLILSGNLSGTTKLKLDAVMRGTIQIELNFGLNGGDIHKKRYLN